jgi:hypothetical protein
MAERLENSENWVTGFPTLGMGKLQDLLTESESIMHIIWESSDDKT